MFCIWFSVFKQVPYGLLNHYLKIKTWFSAGDSKNES